MTSPRLTATFQPIFSPRPKPRLTAPVPVDKATDPGTQASEPTALAAKSVPTDASIFSDRPAPVLTSAIPDAPDLPRVVSIGSLISGGRWRTEAMRSYTRPALYWFTRGQGRATLAGHTRGFTPHTGFLVSPGTMHGFDLIGNVTGMLVFLPRATAAELEDAPGRLSFRDGQRQMELTAVIDGLREACEARDDLAAEAMRHHAGLLSIWWRRAGAQERAGAESDIVQAYSALIEADFHEGLTVADYAARIGVTPTHLTRVCRATSGRSAHELLTSRRLFEAQSRLARGTDPVADIARASGFGSPAYFARAFRKAVGKSPTAFRQAETRHGPFPT